MGLLGTSFLWNNSYFPIWLILGVEPKLVPDGVKNHIFVSSALIQHLVLQEAMLIEEGAGIRFCVLFYVVIVLQRWSLHSWSRLLQNKVNKVDQKTQPMWY